MSDESSMSASVKKNSAKLGLISAALAAVTFGASPLLISLIGAEVSPFALAGILSFGSSLLGVISLLREKNRKILVTSFSQMRSHRYALLGLVVFGGVVAPIFLAMGIQRVSPVEVSIALNFELVATAVIARFFFSEKISRRALFAILIIFVGVLVPVVFNSEGLHLSRDLLGIGFVLLAGVCWGFDNCFSRIVSHLSPELSIIIKGVVGAVVNFLIAVSMGSVFIQPIKFFQLLLIGIICYGLSLRLLLRAFQILGSARGIALFSLHPFFGVTLTSLVFAKLPRGAEVIGLLFSLVGAAQISRESVSEGSAVTTAT